MSKQDDSVAYDHTLLTEESQAYVGFEWDGWWFMTFVNTSVVQMDKIPCSCISMSVLSQSAIFEASLPVSLYIDDRSVGELFTVDIHLQNTLLSVLIFDYFESSV